MIAALLVITYFAFGVSSSCVDPPVGINIDRKAVSGAWWIQDIYGEPLVTNERCYHINFTLTSDNKMNVGEIWKDKSGEWTGFNAPEVSHEVNHHGANGYKFQIKDMFATFWFLDIDYEVGFLAYGCATGDIPNVYIVSRQQQRNEDLVHKLYHKAADLVPIPDPKAEVDQTSC